MHGGAVGRMRVYWENPSRLGGDARHFSKYDAAALFYGDCKRRMERNSFPNDRIRGFMKKIRHAKIIETIQKYDVETQEELANYLRDAGLTVTQATVSRDIRELQLSKIPTGNGRLKYIVLKQDDSHMGDKYIRVLSDGMLSMDMAQNILVCKTVSGMAMAVAAALDALKFPEIVGCIAGDDTIFVAVRTTGETQVLMDKIHKILDK